MDYITRALSFLNLLEADNTKLSISKIYMWATVWLLIYIAVKHPDNIAAVIGAGSTQALATINYIAKRQINKVK